MVVPPDLVSLKSEQSESGNVLFYLFSAVAEASAGRWEDLRFYFDFVLSV